MGRPHRSAIARAAFAAVRSGDIPLTAAICACGALLDLAQRRRVSRLRRSIRRGCIADTLLASRVAEWTRCRLPRTSHTDSAGRMPAGRRWTALAPRSSLPTRTATPPCTLRSGASRNAWAAPTRSRSRIERCAERFQPNDQYEPQGRRMLPDGACAGRLGSFRWDVRCVASSAGNPSIP